MQRNPRGKKKKEKTLGINASVEKYIALAAKLCASHFQLFFLQDQAIIDFSDMKSCAIISIIFGTKV